MKIQIDGTGSVNKGAELMLVSIIREIEKEYPHALVIYNDRTYLEDNQPANFLHSSLRIIKPWNMSDIFVSFIKQTHIAGILSKMNSNFDLINFIYFHNNYSPDILLDASGFAVSDMFYKSKQNIKLFREYYRRMSDNGTQIVLLPQAFGPFDEDYSREQMGIIGDYSRMICVRDEVSEKYIKEVLPLSGKLLRYPDFTCLVKGVVLDNCRKYEGYICIIPNMKMVDKNVSDNNAYISFFEQIIMSLKNNGHSVFVLNHEGQRDKSVCNYLKEKCNVDIVEGLNAEETKGIISISKLVISSRYHGVASALSSCVPCVSTSWSHKYKCLFSDYNQFDCVLDVNDVTASLMTIYKKLEPSENENIRLALQDSLKQNQQIATEMWNNIWQMLK